MKAYGEQRYADALEAVRGALERMPGPRGLQLQVRVLRNARGDTGDEVRPPPRSVELLPRLREDARRDDDFAAVRDEPRFEEALR